MCVCVTWNGDNTNLQQKFLFLRSESFAEKAQSASDSFNFHKDFFLHQVEAHGQQRHAEQKINCAAVFFLKKREKLFSKVINICLNESCIQDEFAVDGVLGLALLVLVNRLAGHEITETDGQQTGETEIGSVHVAPTLYFLVGQIN